MPISFHLCRFTLHGNQHGEHTQSNTISRLAALEARAMKRATLVTILYLPIVFTGYAVLLGTILFPSVCHVQVVCMQDMLLGSHIVKNDCARVIL